MNVQDAVSRLSRFWADQGCLVLPPCEFEIPGGILHPDIFFRLLDREPWRATFLQTVRRPLDGRYGKHPFRLGRHLEFQVILTSPGDGLRDLYVQSLRELDLDLGIHDLRFTEWSWEALSLDAWGLGWRVHLDGLGITRLTFLQQVAGHDLDPVAVEISYGVERLLMALCRTKDAFRLLWAEDGPEYGELWRRDEIEISRYAHEVADVATLEGQLENLRGEAHRALEAGLLRVAYELTVRSLQGVDLLDTRGVLTTRERIERLGRIRELVQQIAARFLAEIHPGEDVREPEEDAAKRAEAAAEAAAEEPEPKEPQKAPKKKRRARRRSKKKEPT